MLHPRRAKVAREDVIGLDDEKREGTDRGDCLQSLLHIGHARQYHGSDGRRLISRSFGQAGRRAGRQEQLAHQPVVAVDPSAQCNPSTRLIAPRDEGEILRELERTLALVIAGATGAVARRHGRSSHGSRGRRSAPIIMCFIARDSLRRLGRR